MSRQVPVGEAQSARAAEEQQIREEYQRQIAEAEATARAEYEKQLAAKIAAVRLRYEGMIEAEKAQYDLDVMIAEAAEVERTKFLESLAGKKAVLEKDYQKSVAATKKTFQKRVQTEIRRAKREAAMRAKTYAPVSPRILRAYKKTEMEIFEEAVEAETEVFGQELQKWKERAVGEYETGLEEWKVEELAAQEKAMAAWEKGEKAAMEQEISVYKQQAAAELETQITTWKKEEAAKFEPELEKWREAWREPSIAEQMLQWKAPDLPTIDIELFKVPVAGGYLRIGFDLGKFVEGLAEGSVAAGAGLVASGESLAYSIGTLAGLETPRPPPTLVAGLIQAVPASIGAGELRASPQLEEMAEMEYGFTYAAASLLGDVIISYAIGKGVEKGAAVVGKTRVGAYVATKAAPVLRPIAKLQYKIGQLAQPVTKPMVKAAEWIISPIYKVKAAAAAALAKKAPTAIAPAVPRGVLVDVTKAGQYVDEPFTAFKLAEARWGSIAQVVPEEQVAQVMQPLDEAMGLTVSEKWTRRAIVDLKAMGFKPIKQMKYGAAWGEPYFPYPKPTEPSVLAQPSLPIQKWTVRAMKHQLGAAGALPTTFEGFDDLGLPKDITEYIKPWKPPKPPKPEGVVMKAGKQMLILEKPQLVKPLLKVKPELRMQAWIIRAQKEALKAPALVKPHVPIQKWVVKAQTHALKAPPLLKEKAPLAKPTPALPTVKPKVDPLAAMLGLKAAVVPKLALKQELAQTVKQVEKQREKAREKVKVAIIPISVPAVSPKMEPVQLPAVTPKEAAIAVQKMKQEQLQLQKQREKEEKKRRKEEKKLIRDWQKRAALFEYPVRPEKEVPSFIFEGLGKTTRQRKPAKGLNLSDAIFGKKKRRRRK
jgi:hypothetical protein